MSDPAQDYFSSEGVKTPSLLLDNSISGSCITSAESEQFGEFAKTTCAGKVRIKESMKVHSGITYPKAAVAGCIAMTFSAYNGTSVHLGGSERSSEG